MEVGGSSALLLSAARMEASSSAPNNELALLLESVATQLPQLVLLIVLRPLPTIELARLACVHKSFQLVLLVLREQTTGQTRYAAPTADDLNRRIHGCSRLARAGFFGDVAVIASMVAAGVDEHGTPLKGRAKAWSGVPAPQAREPQSQLQADCGYQPARSLDFALWLAALEGHLQAVQMLLAAGALLHSQKDQALKYATEGGHAAIVQLLLERGAHVNEVFRTACSRGNIEIVELLLEYGANVHAGNDTALFAACHLGHTDIVTLLLESGAYVRALLDAPLIAACDEGRTAVVEVLIQHGADVHARNGRPLRVATLKGHQEVMQLLIQHGAGIPTAV